MNATLCSLHSNCCVLESCVYKNVVISHSRDQITFDNLLHNFHSDALGGSYAVGYKNNNEANRFRNAWGEYKKIRERCINIYLDVNVD